MEILVGKIIVLREICEVRDKLFGPFNNNRTPQMKCKLWTNICEKAKSLGLVAADKDYRFMRDVYWQNIKRTALHKREKQQISGNKYKRGPIDDIVFEILDNTSPLHSQKPPSPHRNPIRTYAKPQQHSVMLTRDKNIEFEMINEDEDMEASTANNDHEQSSGETNATEMNSIDEKSDQLKEEPEDEADIILLHQNESSKNDTEVEASSNKPDETVAATVTRIMNFDEPNQKDKEDNTDSIDNMNKRKAQLEIDLLELQKYKAQLEVLQLETKLGVEPSRFTKEVAKRRKKNKLVFEHDDDEPSDYRSDSI